MAHKITKELRKLSVAELQKRLAEYRKELYHLRFQQITGKLENYAHIREVRKNIARVLTLLRERQMGGK